MQVRSSPRFPFLTGIESSYIRHSGKDVLDTTRHIERFPDDLKLVAQHGMKMIRYAAPWHRIERIRGAYDWSYMDAAMREIRRLGLTPILDPLHLTSIPDWLEEDFLSPQLPQLYCAFVEKLVDRYPWVTQYTVVNEPQIIAQFCGNFKIWSHRESDAAYVAVAINLGKTVCITSAMLRKRVLGVRLVHVDCCESHRAVDEISRQYAQYRDDFRFFMHDLILGRVTAEHPLYGFARDHGFTEEDEQWFVANAAPFDVLGLDFYYHNEFFWQIGGLGPRITQRGFATVAMEYAERYNVPLMLSETNIRGHLSDRITWLKFMVEESERLADMLEERGLYFAGFCWYPWLDSTDWDTLLRECNGNLDPQGIIMLAHEPSRHRHTSELSQLYGRLARGEITHKQIPAYEPRPPVDGWLAPLRHLMAHWRWEPPQNKHIKRADAAPIEQRVEPEEIAGSNLNKKGSPKEA